MQQNSFSYPAMLDLKNKKCVIIGGGKVADNDTFFIF